MVNHHTFHVAILAQSLHERESYNIAHLAPLDLGVT